MLLRHILEAQDRRVGKGAYLLFETLVKIDPLLSLHLYTVLNGCGT